MTESESAQSDPEDYYLEKAKQAELEYDAIDVLTEILLEALVWGQKVDDAQVREEFKTKFGVDGLKRIKEQASILARRRMNDVS